MIADERFGWISIEIIEFPFSSHKPEPENTAMPADKRRTCSPEEHQIQTSNTCRVPTRSGVDPYFSTTSRCMNIAAPAWSR